MTKVVPAALQTHLDGTVTTLTMLFEVTSPRTNRTIRLTSLDRDVDFNGFTWYSAGAYARSAIEMVTGPKSDTVDANAIIDTDLISEEDLLGERYDHAPVKWYLINYESPSDGAIKSGAGWFGGVTVRASGQFHVEMNLMTHRLRRKIVELVSPMCAADLGDARCKIPIDPDVVARSTAYAVGDFVKFPTAPNTDEDYSQYENRIYECTTAGTTAASLPGGGYDSTVGNTTTDGTAVFTAREAWSRHFTVDTVIDRRTFDVADFPEADGSGARGGFPDDWFRQGVVTFSTGQNAGVSREVKAFTHGTDATQELKTWLKFPFDIQVGDVGWVYRGCDFLFATCRDVFDNVNNFRGFPHVPGNDDFLRSHAR